MMMLRSSMRVCSRTADDSITYFECMRLGSEVVTLTMRLQGILPVMLSSMMNLLDFPVRELGMLGILGELYMELGAFR